MNFYSYDYLINQNNTNRNVISIIIIFILISLIIIGMLWYFHRTDFKHQRALKYRDSFIILILIMLFFIVFQFNGLKEIHQGNIQKSQVTQILKQISAEKKVNLNSIWCNTSNISTGMLVKVKNNIYNVTLNPDNKSFVLSKSIPLTNKINYIKGGH